MNEDLINVLLHQSEGSTLDFKREQYRLTDNAEKSELLKDILAFANAWKASDAHILIGIEENPDGGKVRVVGLTDHPDDACLQQLVNSKTNRPVHFNYRAMSINGISIGIITIYRDQDRPLYVLKDFGTLKQGVVKIRRGSSTADASPDEIAEMGVARAMESRSTPRIEFEFAEPARRRRLGQEVRMTPIRFVEPLSRPPLASHAAKAIEAITAMQQKHSELLERLQSGLSVFQTKEPTPQDRFSWRQSIAQMCCVGFWARNAGDSPLTEVLVVIKGHKEEAVVIWDETCHPIDEQYMPFGGTFRLPTTTNVKYEEHVDELTIEVLLGKLQPKSEFFVGNLLYIGSLEPKQLDWNAKVFSDEISDPVELNLRIVIEPIEVEYDEDRTEPLDHVRSVGAAEPLARASQDVVGADEDANS